MGERFCDKRHDDDDDDDDNNNNNNTPTIYRHRRVERVADKRGFVRRNRGLLTAIQDQVILTRNYKKYILKEPDKDELCRRCGRESETIQHMTVAREQLASTEYVMRLDGLAKVIHQKLAEAAELIAEKVHIISTHQPMYWRMKFSSCTGIAAYLRTEQYLLIDLTQLL